MRMKVLVTPRSVTRGGHPSLEKLRAAGCEIVYCTPCKKPGEDELRALLPSCAGWLAGIEPITARVLEAATELRVISRNGTGVDNVDLAAAEARGIAVLRAEGANARGVAELAIGQLFALARGIGASDAALKRGAWERQSPGVELEGKTLGLAGCGRVGKLVAQMALGIGMRVVAFDLFPDPAFAPGPGFRFAAIAEVIASADFPSLHCPPAADGQPLLDAAASSSSTRRARMSSTQTRCVPRWSPVTLPVLRSTASASAARKTRRTTRTSPAASSLRGRLKSPDRSPISSSSSSA